MANKINVFSEIGVLKTVLVHRPGAEVENLTPELLERLLFDDIPFLKVAKEEHDTFTDLMRQNGVEVLYVETLAAEALDQNPDLKPEFIDQFKDLKSFIQILFLHAYLQLLVKRRNE